jgi:quinol monooxygenase YgiN
MLLIRAATDKRTTRVHVEYFSRQPEILMSHEPITVVITCVVKADKLDFARHELATVIGLVMANEPACHGIRVHEDPRDPRRLLIIEQWESEEIFTGPHMQMPHMQTFMKTAETFVEGTAEFGFWKQILAA